MPITRSALKKQRQDVHRAHRNLIVKRELHEAIKLFRRSPSEKKIAGIFSLLDRAQKKQIVHANKVSRLKSRFSKLISGKPVAAVTTKTKKVSVKKTAKKKVSSKTK
jgi:small subunit ribosomal protein S20